MANKETISELIDEKAFKDIERLISTLGLARNELGLFISEAVKSTNALGGAKTFKEFEISYKKASVELNKLPPVINKIRLDEIKLQQAREKSIDKYNAQLAKQIATQEKNNAKVVEASRAYNKLSKELEQARKNAKDIGVTFGTSSVQFKKAAKEVNELDQNLKKIDSSLGQNQRNVGNYGSALNGLGNNIKNLVLGFFGFQAAVSGVGSAFTKSLEIDSVKTSLEFIFRNTGDVTERMKMLKETSERLGIEFSTLAASYKSFAGAAVASNFPLAQADKLFQSVANASSKLRLSSEQTEGALNALQQMISKGNVQAEELRGQLGERIPGAFSIAARAMGVTEIQLNKLLKDGKVLASDLLPKLADELNKTFDNDTTKRADSLQSSVNRLKNIFANAVEEGNVSVFFKSLVDGFSTIAETIAKTVTSTGWNEFFSRLTSNKEADVIRGINIAFRDGRKEIEAVNKSGTATQAQYNAISIALKNARTQYDIYAKAVKNGALKSGGNSTLGQYIQLIKELEYQQSRLNNLVPKDVQGPSIINTDTESDADRKKRLSKSLRDSLELQRQLLEAEKQRARAIINNENATLDERLRAVATFRDKSIAITKVTKEIELTEENISATKRKSIAIKAENDILDIKNDSIAETLKINKQAEKELSDLLSSGFGKLRKSEQDRLLIVQDAAQDRLLEIEKSRANEIEAIANAYSDGIINAGTYNQRLLEIESKAAGDRLDVQIAAIRKQIEIDKENVAFGIITNKELAADERKLTELEIQASDIKTKKKIENAEKVKEALQDLHEKEKQLAFEIAEVGINAINSVFQSKQEKITFEDEQATQRADLERTRIEESLLSEDEKKIKLAQIDDRERARKDQVDAKQREIQAKQARFEKLIAVARIAVSVFEGVAKTKAAAAPLTAGLPFTAPLIAATLAQIPILIGIGAAQTAAVLATKIPAFEKGGTKQGDGLARYSEGGKQELMITPDGKYSLTPPQETIGHVKHGTKFISNPDLKRMIAKPEKINYAGLQQISFDEVIKSQDKNTARIERALNNLPPSTQITKSGWRRTQKKINGWTEYLGSNFN